MKPLIKMAAVAASAKSLGVGGGGGSGRADDRNEIVNSRELGYI